MQTVWTDNGSVMISVSLRRLVLGWLITTQYGPVYRRRWVFRQWKTRAPYDAAVWAAGCFADRAGWIERQRGIPRKKRTYPT